MSEEKAPRARRRPRARKDAAVEAAPEAEAAAPVESAAVETAEDGEPAPKPRRGRRKKVDEAAADTSEATPPPEPAAETAPKPRRPRRKAEPAVAAPVETVLDDAPEAAPAEDDVAQPQQADAAPTDTGSEDDASGEGGTRRGWWQRTFGA